MSLDEETREALRKGDFAGAAVAAKSLISAEPDRASGYFLLGLVAAESGHIAKAVPLMQAAVERGPEPEHLAQLAKLLILLRRDGEAAAAAEQGLALEPDDPLSLDTIGCVFARLGRHEESLLPFSRAVAGQPDNLEYRYNLAAANGFAGQMVEAAAHYEVILRENPGHARAHYALAILARQSAESNHVPRLRTALAAAEKPQDVLRINYALAKELEDIGEPDEAFSHLAQANALHKQTIHYSFEQDAAIFDAIEDLFGGSRPPLAVGAGSADSSPIFIVGMPRTGTTLVDRILSSHPDVGSAGELQAMPLAVKRLSGTASRTVIDPETIMASGVIDPGKVASAYLAQASHHRPPGKARFIDKLPANFLYIGHIARALPQSSIVCLRRNPMDTVWSNYKNLFASQSAYYAYSYDLLDTARYYARFDRLVALWERLFPGRILQLSYEQLVADQEGQTRRLLDHCGLSWDANCLSFHQNSAAVATPSAAQVRRPINADAIGRWRQYEDQMRPAAEWLEAAGIAVR